MNWRKFLILNLLSLVVISIVSFYIYKSQLGRGIFVDSEHPVLFEEPKILPDTVVGSLDLSGATIPEAKKRINTYINKKTYINFPHRSFAVFYGDLGVTFNLDVLKDFARRCFISHSACKGDLPTKDLSSLLVDLDEDKFNAFVASLNGQVKLLLLNPDISFDDLTFQAHNPEASIVVDKEALLSQLTAENIFSDREISISTVLSDPGDTDIQRQETERLVEETVAQNLLIKYGRQPVDIGSETLKGFINLGSKDGETVAVISEKAIQGHLDSLRIKYPINIQLEEGAAVLSIAYALLFRVGGEDPKTAVILPQKGGPSTDGTYANKYLELNKTRQRMYAFENKKLVKTYIVGTGLTWETPSGEFKVLRKSGTAISYTGGWYMPYYMPIGTVYGYFFGFHEIPYRKNAQGQITSRDVNTMGSPATGGCIQLYRKDAKELYEWADIGTPVLISD